MSEFYRLVLFTVPEFHGSETAVKAHEQILFTSRSLRYHKKSILRGTASPGATAEGTGMS